MGTEVSDQLVDVIIRRRQYSSSLGGRESHKRGYRFYVRTFHAQYAESNVQPIPRKHPLEQSKDPLQ